VDVVVNKQLRFVRARRCAVEGSKFAFRWWMERR
jgi:hypothetical protein